MRPMEDSKASCLAAAVGCVALGGFWAARPSAAPKAIRVVEQVTFANGIGADPDAAVAFRVRLPSVVQEALDDNRPVSYRLIDRQGRIYPLGGMSDVRYAGALKLSRGYAEGADHPRLEVVAGEQVLAAAAVQDIPAPVDHHMPLGPSPIPVKLTYRGGGWLTAEARRPIPAMERWRIVALRTRHGAPAASFAELPAAGLRQMSQRIEMPFAEQAERAEVEFVRFKLQPVTTTVHLPNLRLVEKFGNVALVVDEDTVVPNSMGAHILLPKQYSGPRRPARVEVPRRAAVNLIVIPPWLRDATPGEWRRERGCSVEIVSPRPEWLGVRQFSIGNGVLVALGPSLGPVRTEPFTAVVRLTALRPVPIERVRTVIQIAADPKPWPTSPLMSDFQASLR